MNDGLDGYADFPAVPLVGTLLTSSVGTTRLAPDLAEKFTGGPAPVVMVTLLGAALIGVELPEGATPTFSFMTQVEGAAELVAQLIVCMERAGVAPAFHAHLDREIVAARVAGIGQDLRHE